MFVIREDKYIYLLKITPTEVEFTSVNDIYSIWHS